MRLTKRKDKLIPIGKILRSLLYLKILSYGKQEETEPSPKGLALLLLRILESPIHRLLVWSSQHWRMSEKVTLISRGAWSLVTQASTILMQMILQSLLVTHVGALLDQDKRVSLSAMSVSTIWIIRDLEH